jgi:glutathione S-transferase
MDLELVSFVLCPYVQRAVIALREKGVAHRITYIDLNDPPDWFKAVSPFGKVPLLIVGTTAGEGQPAYGAGGRTVVFESAVINEYLDDVYPPRLHPADPLERARHRGWVEFASALLGDLWQLMTAETEERCRQLMKEIGEKLARLDPQLGAGGPFFGGPDFSLVDCACAPFFMRWEILCDLRPELRDLLPARVGAWSSALLGRPSVQGSVVEDFRARFLAHYDEKGGWLFEPLQ